VVCISKIFHAWHDTIFSQERERRNVPAPWGLRHLVRPLSPHRNTRENQHITGITHGLIRRRHRHVPTTRSVLASLPPRLHFDTESLIFSPNRPSKCLHTFTIVSARLWYEGSLKRAPPGETGAGTNEEGPTRSRLEQTIVSAFRIRMCS